MTNPTPARPAWIRWAVLAVLVIVIWVLYPQLKDLGGEIYRFFA